jgi:hypothetical protein
MIRDEKGENLISEEVFTRLFLIGELSEKDFDSIVQRFLQDKEKDKYLGPVKDQEKLIAFKKRLSNFFVSLEDKINQQIENLDQDFEKSRDKFIDSFKPSQRISKCEIQKLCGLSKATMIKYRDNFKDYGSKGIQLNSFLEWLKLYDLKQYERFKVEYGKRGGGSLP